MDESNDPRSEKESRATERSEAAVTPRRSRRLPIPGVLVAVDAPEIAAQPWVVDAIDINANGIGLVLPPEVPEGAQVLLSFRLDNGEELAQVPASVRHKDGVSGGVRFGEWPRDDRLKLLEFLVETYERG